MECIGAATSHNTLSSETTRVAIFASGRGSNARALIEALQASADPAMELVGLVTDRPGAGVIDIAQSHGVEVAIIPRANDSRLKRAERQREHEERLLDYLRQRQVNLVLLAGYMRMVGPTLLEHFYDESLGVARIVNIHPSLLPAFPGKNAYYDAHRAGVNRYGCTLHFIDAGMDSGPVIFQRSFAMTPGHSIEEVVEHGLKEEHTLYRHFLDCWQRGIIQQSFRRTPEVKELTCKTLH